MSKQKNKNQYALFLSQLITANLHIVNGFLNVLQTSRCSTVSGIKETYSFPYNLPNVSRIKMDITFESKFPGL